MGPTILAEMLMAGRDLEAHVRGVMGAWEAQSKNFSQAVFSEAVNLARMLHLAILEAGCPRFVLRTSLVPEVALRRLFCLLEVERQVATADTDRKRAWRSVECVLEHHAEAFASGATMSKYIADRFNQAAKFEANFAKQPPGPKN